MTESKIKKNCEENPTILSVSMSDGSVVELKLEDYAKETDQLIWVSEELGLSPHAPLTEKVDNMLYDMYKNKYLNE